MDENTAVDVPGLPSLFWSPDSKQPAAAAATRQPLQDLFFNECLSSPPEKIPLGKSEDYIPTSQVNPSQDEERVEMVYMQRVQPPLTVVGGREDITMGRGTSVTVKIGRRNRQISRVHAKIQYKADTNEYEFVVLGLNGAVVDDVRYLQNERCILKDSSLIDILGNRIRFTMPHESLCENVPTESHRPVSPPPEENKKIEPVLPAAQEPADQITAEVKQQQQQEEEEKKMEKEEFIKVEPEQEVPSAKQSQGQQQLEKSEPLPTQHDTVKKEPEEQQQQQQQEQLDAPLNYAEVIIDVLVFSRKSSMPVSDICSRIVSTHPAYKNVDRNELSERVRQTLKEKPFFGEIVRKGKTADGSPKENLYYYNSEADPVEWRRAEYTHVGRSARKCTLQDKQYFFKIPPKLGRNRNAYVPPPAKAYEEEQLQNKRSRSDRDDSASKKQRT